MSRIKEYKNLKKHYSDLLKQPVGNRIKKGGLLENRIKTVFSSERAKQILTRTENVNFDEYEKIKNRLYTLREELEKDGFLIYDNEGNEILIP